MNIQTVSLIGLGALGAMFGKRLSESMEFQDLRIVADRERIDRYTSRGIFCNGEKCHFNYVLPETAIEPADLIIIGVKFNGLDSAIDAIRRHVGDTTLIISMLNGISSEDIIGKAFGKEKVVHCVAQEMDALKVDNQITYHNMGRLCIGDLNSPLSSEPVNRISRFFTAHNFPHLVDNHMQKRLWGKFMLNVGVNQAVAVYETDFEGVQKEGEPRTTMTGAMKEVISLSQHEGIHLGDEDLNYWVAIIDSLNPKGKPSLRQDHEARRFSEVELFSGTVCRLARKQGVATPVNDYLYTKIKEIESSF